MECAIAGTRVTKIQLYVTVETIHSNVEGSRKDSVAIITLSKIEFYILTVRTYVCPMTLFATKKKIVQMVKTKNSVMAWSIRKRSA